MRHLTLLLLTACAPTTLPTTGGATGTPDPLAPLVRPQLVPAYAEAEVPADPAPAAWPFTGARSVSGRLARLPGSRFAVIADADAGAVHRVDLESRETTTVSDLGEATRLVLVGDTAAVTLREEGRVALLRWDNSGAVVQGPRRDVGTEPYDVVASPSAARLYVSLSLDDAVVELDGSTLAELRRWIIPGEPRWLAVADTGAGERLLVASAAEPVVTEIGLATGEVLTHTLPTLQRFADPDCPGRPLTPRITGELTVTAAGTLYVPAQYADTDVTGAPLPAACEATAPAAEATAWATASDVREPGRPGRFDAAVVALDLTAPARSLMVRTVASNLADFGASPPVTVVRSAPTSVAVEEDAQGDAALYVALEGSDAIVFVDLRRAPLTSDTGLFAPSSRSAMPARASVAELRLDGPGPLWAWSWLEGTLLTYDRSEIAIVHDTTEDFAGLGFPFPVIEFSGPTDAFSPAPDALPADVRRGRDLFHTAVDGDVAASGSGASCAGCHDEGRVDHRTWHHADLARQTPPLTGRLSETAPFAWTGAHATLEVAIADAVGRMGGLGLAAGDVADLAAFLAWTRDPVAPDAATPADALLRDQGRALFGRPDLACATCHAGPRLTDGQSHDLGAGPLHTPTLVGLAATAPYLHDGLAPTLGVLLDRHAPAPLTDAERDALAAFLRGL